MGVWVGGCASSPDGQGIAFGPYYPPAPHAPRVQYLRSFAGGPDFAGPGGGFWRILFGGSTGAREPLVKPYGLAAADGRLYVCDTSRGDVFVFDFAGRSFDRFPHPDVALAKPIAVCVADGNVLICDVGLGAVLEFTPEGRLLGSVDLATMRQARTADSQRSSDGKTADSEVGRSGKMNAAVPEGFRPVGIRRAADGTALVLNSAAHRVEVLDLSSGRQVGGWSGPGNGPGQLYFPTALTQGPDGTVWVADRLNRRVTSFAPDGRVLSAFGDAGDQPGYLSQPRGLAVDDHGVVYEVDAGLPGVQLFDAAGEYLMGFGYPGDDGPQLSLPAGICLDRSSLPYFADWIRPGFEAEYLIFVAEQVGPKKIHVYAFGRLTPSPAKETETALAWSR